MRRGTNPEYPRVCLRYDLASEELKFTDTTGDVSCNGPHFPFNPILLSLGSFGPLIIPPKHHYYTTYSLLYQAKQLV